MNQDFVLATLTFTIVMVIFNIVKDYYIIPKFKPSNEKLEKINTYQQLPIIWRNLFSPHNRKGGM